MDTHMTPATHNHIDATIEIVRACGPVGRDEIAREIRIQAQNGTRENCYQLADAAIAHGLSQGWLVRYDDIPDAYNLAP
jgi:hypothetical protein